MRLKLASWPSPMPSERHEALLSRHDKTAAFTTFLYRAPHLYPVLNGQKPTLATIRHPCMENSKMDVLYVGGLVVFAALTFGLIAGCEKLMQFRRSDRGARS